MPLTRRSESERGKWRNRAKNDEQNGISITTDMMTTMIKSQDTDIVIETRRETETDTEMSTELGIEMNTDTDPKITTDTRTDIWIGMTTVETAAKAGIMVAMMIEVAIATTNIDVIGIIDVMATTRPTKNTTIPKWICHILTTKLLRLNRLYSNHHHSETPG